MTRPDYIIAVSALNDRAKAIIFANLGNLAPHTDAWREVLQLGYLSAYLTRESVAVNLVD